MTDGKKHFLFHSFTLEYIFPLEFNRALMSDIEEWVCLVFVSLSFVKGVMPSKFLNFEEKAKVYFFSPFFPHFTNKMTEVVSLSVLNLQ